MLDLICLDVDGTLVGSSGVPSDRLWQAADSARHRGQHLTLCTARLAAGPTRGWAERLDPDGWHIFHTGAVLWHPSSGEVISVPLPDGTVEAAVEIAEKRSWVLETYSWDDYATDSDDPLAVAHAGLLDLPYARRRPASLDQPAVRVQFVVPSDQTQDALAAAPVGTEASAATSPSMPGVSFVSVIADGVSKASGVATVAAQLGVDLEATMMVGDGHNDVPALVAVGWGVAMANAETSVQTVARRVTGDVDDDGAAQAIDLSAVLDGRRLLPG